MNEDHLIALLTKNWKCDADVLCGVGDDCAVLRGPGAKDFLLFKTDAVVEGHHFTKKTPAHLIGRKALARVLSDIAAMGGTPRHALITLGIPAKFSPKRFQAIYAGITRLARQYHVNLIGGETTRTGELLLSISALGETRGYRPILRSGAKAEDYLFVTGRLGRTLHGKQLTFIPRLSEGQFLAKHHLATAMMDLSDGMGSDLPRLARASKVGFDLELKNLPRARGVSWKEACSDGEDYELLFTVRPKDLSKLQTSWPFKTTITQIGRIIPRSEIHNRSSHMPHGFDHLQQP